MKTITIKLLIMAIPVIMMSCNSSQNRNKDNKNASNTMSNDSVTKSAFLVGNNDKDHNKDQEFIKEAAIGGFMEVELGKYAQQHAVNPRVKNFGAMMVRDHSKANDELKSIASRKNMNISTNMDDKHRDMMSDIQKKTGADFDKAYMKDMVDDHEKDVSLFKKQADNGSDPDLKVFAEKTLTVLIMHQDSAKKISDAITK